MVFESLQARLGMGGAQRQFVDLESARDLEDISDPETTTDESSTALREWAATHPGWAVVLGLGSLIALGLFVRWSARFAVGFVTSPWTYVTLASVTVLGLTFRRGWRSRDSQITTYDELHLKTGRTTRSYKGRYVELTGRADAFVAIKGWSGIFNSPNPYQNGEIAAGMGESFDPWSLEEDAPAVIRLEPGENGTLVGISDTEWGGKKIVQETNGLVPDPDGNYTSLRCTLPEFDDERVDGLRKQNEQMTKDLRDSREEIDALQRRNRNLKDRMNEPITEEVEERIGQFERLSYAAGGGPSRRGGSGGHDTPRQPRPDYKGNGAMTADDELQQVEEELKDDED